MKFPMRKRTKKANSQKSVLAKSIFMASVVLLPVSLLHYTFSPYGYQADNRVLETKRMTVIRDFDSGILNAQPAYYKRNECTTIRFRGDGNNYTVNEALNVLQGKYKLNPGPRALRLGIQFLETPSRFFPILRKSYHLFHFVELLVIAYAELNRLTKALPRRHANLDGTTSLEQGSPAIMVPWIMSPHMSPSEICGRPTGINCLIADLVLRSTNESIFQDKSGIVGLDVMDEIQYNSRHERKAIALTRGIPLADRLFDPAHQSSQDFTNQADGVVIVERHGCRENDINKPWLAYIDDFPADAWHADIMKSLGGTTAEYSGKDKIVVGYIDRQNSTRRLRDDHHVWLVDFLENHAQVDFLHLLMETYPAIEQIRIASQIDVLIGVHGNGMSHSFWMKPGSRVIELFWWYAFQFDYATAAQIMRHHYLCILNGKVIDKDMISRRDAALRTDKESQSKVNKTQAAKDFSQEGKVAIEAFLEEAIQELH